MTENKPNAVMFVASDPNEAPRRTIQFSTDAGVVGTLYLGPPMRFEGDAEESARVFFEQVIQKYV